MKMWKHLLLCLYLTVSVNSEDNSTTLGVEFQNATSLTELLPASTTNSIPTTTDPDENNYEYIVKLEYYFKEDKIPDFISDVISKGIAETQISVADIIELTGLQNFSLNDTEEFLYRFGIPSSYIFSIGSLEKILSSLNIEFTKFYVDLNHTLALSPTAISQVLKDLEIDAGKFTLAIVLGEYNVYEVLRNGTFTDESIQRVVNTTQISQDDLFLALRNVLLENVKKLDKQDFDRLLASNGIDQTSLLLLWKVFDIRTEDVYRVEAFRKFIADIIFNLNKMTSIGVITSKNTLFLHTNDYETCQNVGNFIKTTTRSFVNYSITSEVGSMIKKVSRNIVELDLKNKSSVFIDVGIDYTAKVFENCTYITFVKDSLIFQGIDIVRNYVDYLEIDNTNQTFYYPGSPLICDNRLYGMAAAKRRRTIDFDSFNDYHEGKSTATSMSPQKTTHEGSAVINSSNKFRFEMFPLTLMLLILFLVL